MSEITPTSEKLSSAQSSDVLKYSLPLATSLPQCKRKNDSVWWLWLQWLNPEDAPKWKEVQGGGSVCVGGLYLVGLLNVLSTA